MILDAICIDIRHLAPKPQFHFNYVFQLIFFVFMRESCLFMIILKHKRILKHIIDFFQKLISVEKLP